MDNDVWNSEDSQMNQYRCQLIFGVNENDKRIKIYKSILSIDFSVKFNDIRYEHKDQKQIEKDILRSYANIENSHHKEAKREDLRYIIYSVLNIDAELRYYQGFHTLCILFNDLYDKELAVAFLRKLCKGHLRPYFSDNIDAERSLMILVIPLSKKFNPELHKTLKRINEETFHAFSIQNILTWFTYGSKNRDLSTRLIDFFIATHPLMPVYFFVATLNKIREDIYENVNNNSKLSALIKNITIHVNINETIKEAFDFYKDYPPSRLFNNDWNITLSPYLSYLDPDYSSPYEIPNYPTAPPITKEQYEWVIRSNKGYFHKVISFISGVLSLFGF